VQLRVTDRTRYDPPRVAVTLLAALAAQYPDSFRFRAGWFDRLAAGPDLRRALVDGRTARQIWSGWSESLARFRRTRSKYLLY